MKTNTNVTINKYYLREIIKKAGLTQKAFAESIGRTSKYISNSLTRGYMQLVAANLICKLYDANIDLLCPKPVEQQQEAKFLMSDDKTLSALVESLNRIEKSLIFWFPNLDTRCVNGYGCDNGNIGSV